MAILNAQNLLKIQHREHESHMVYIGCNGPSKKLWEGFKFCGKFYWKVMNMFIVNILWHVPVASDL